MANDVNKVIYGNTTVMDITDTTAEEGDVVRGKTFYKANGARSTGSAVIPDISNCYQTTDTAETDIQDADYFPFYDTSATAKRKTLWSNIKAKLKAYFDTVYATLASPAFTGTPTAPTAYTSTATSQIATTSFVHNVTASKYDYNDPYTSTLSDDDTHIPILNTSGQITAKRTKLGNIRPVFILRTGLTATAGTTIRIPASGTNEFISYGCHVEPVCDSQSGKGIKYNQIACHDYDGQAGYVEIRLAENITNRTIGIKVIGR